MNSQPDCLDRVLDYPAKGCYERSSYDQNVQEESEFRQRADEFFLVSSSLIICPFTFAGINSATILSIPLSDGTPLSIINGKHTIQTQKPNTLLPVVRPLFLAVPQSPSTTSPTQSLHLSLPWFYAVSIWVQRPTVILLVFLPLAAQRPWLKTTIDLKFTPSMPTSVSPTMIQPTR